MTHRLTYNLNALALFCLAIPLVGALGIQLTGDLPCPLCLLERVAMFSVAIGLVLNLRYGLNPSHYAMSMLGALMGLVISGRHVLLHVSGPPGSGYGGAFLGLHLYTWALIVFFCFLIGASVLLLGSAQFETENDSSPRVGWNTSLWARLTSYLIFALCAINAGMAFMECGPLECPENPTGYWIFGH